MAETTTYDAILAAAREAFGERGYSSVTIREIALRAGCSAAMVMKAMGSKERLFILASPGMTPWRSAPFRSEEPMGYEFARRTLRRRDVGESDPWAILPLIIQDAPDPAVVRESVKTGYVRAIAAMIGDETADLRHASIVVCLILGLAAGTHTLGLLADYDTEALVQRYGAFIQQEIELCTGIQTAVPSYAVPSEARGVSDDASSVGHRQ